MSVEFWNQRYAEVEYVYGTEPNEFVRQQLSKLKPGRILFPAEGEGRNAVFAARLGFEVFAFDASHEARKKAMKLASDNGMVIDYQLQTYESATYPENFFDYIVLVFAHMPPGLRTIYHQKLLTFLSTGGTIILQGFAKDQIIRNTGGPKDIDMLFSGSELRDDFKSLREMKVWDEVTFLNEGPYHRGEASVMNLVGRK
jgi:cyclopropane fatty-acyl-phospholipid synthase-like methyltransferase